MGRLPALCVRPARPGRRSCEVVLLFLLTSTVLALTAGHSFAATYYIATNGNDSNPGTEASPWLNPWTIATRTFSAGDTIYLRGGTYIIQTQVWSSHNGPTVHVRQSGTAGNPITIRNYPGENPILDGTSNSTHAILGTHDDYSVNYHVFDGIEVTNSTPTTGGNLMGLRSGTNHTIQNCKVHGTDLSVADNVSAIRIEPSSNSLIKNCELYDIHNAGEDANASGITIYNSSNITIENVEIHTAPAGVHLKTGTGDLDTIILRNSYLHNLTSYAVGVSFAPLDLIDNFQVYRNIFAAVPLATKQDSGGDAGQVNNMLFYNNVIYDYSAAAFRGPEYQSSTGFKAYNNITYRAGSISLQDVETYDKSPNCSGASVVITTLNYNLYYRTTGFSVLYGRSGCNETYTSLSSWQGSGHGYDANSVQGSDPLFVGPLTSAIGFKLQGASPAKSLGRVGGTSGGAVVDAGAYPVGDECVGLIEECSSATPSSRPPVAARPPVLTRPPVLERPRI